MTEAIIEALYVSLFVAMIALEYRRMKIRQTQDKRRRERKKELEQKELDKNCEMMYKLYKLENQKANRQTITVKGVFAEPLAKLI